MVPLSSLPPEKFLEVRCYLSVRSLLEFGLTPKNNRALQSCSLSKLRIDGLGVCHSRLGDMISLIEVTVDRNCLHGVQMSDRQGM